MSEHHCEKSGEHQIIYNSYDDRWEMDCEYILTHCPFCGKKLEKEARE